MTQDDVILNVDDLEAQRYVKRRDLEAGGFSVVDATTGADALRLIEQLKPPVVLLDVQLPDISGHDVCRYIKGKWPEVMVLMTSATFVTSEGRTRGLDAGADSYLVQPAEPLELAAAVNALLRIRRSEDALRSLNVSLDAQVKERGAELARAINALRTSADRMRTLLQTTYIFQGYMLPDGTLLDVNRASLEGMHAKFEDVVGRAFWETPWFTGTPGMPEAVREFVARAAKGESVQQSIVVNLPDGERAFDMALRPVKNDRGDVIGIVPEAVETTQRLQAEAALRQAMKMEAIGQLTGGIAHDFNNLLTAVVGNLDLIRVRSTEQNVRKWAENAFKAAERGSRLTSQLLAFSRTQKLDTAAINVNGLIGGMKELLDQSLGASVTSRFELAENLPAILADANQLELAILNLSLNARDAMPGGGTLTIATASAKDDAKSILVSVTDTGTGMTPDVVARAFDPFFTTKPTGKGTGLGLSQVYGIVRQAGGDVTIDSKLGRGTKITMRLPRAAADVVTAQRDDSTLVRGAKGEKLLLVDDDPDVRDIVSRVLSELGYDVREAGGGDEALAAFSDFNPDLLIVDFAMPNMNGAEVVTAARANNKEQKILFLSGYADSGILEAAVGSAPLLRKPFRPADLAAAVRGALDTKN
ncbi:MAG TPA: response regulator [Xanthobacteraceae bacterium]|jgi:signal transduction histidine kinase|nr:response regulator [Xanthobacteraceae bacterium]